MTVQIQNQKVRKAVIPAAGLGTRFLPATKAIAKEMLPIVDKPTIQFIVEEALKSGIEDILIVTGKAKRPIEDHFDSNIELEMSLKEKGKDDLLKLVEETTDINLHFIRQSHPKGLGHAVLQAKAFIGDEPFAVLLGDDVVVNNDAKPALKQLIDAYVYKEASVVGVQTVEHGEIDKYGIVSPSNSYQRECGGRLVKLNDMVEKPNVDEAPSDMAVLGRYVLTPKIFELLENQEKGAGGEIQLTDAIKRLMDIQAVYAYDFEGIRYDVGDKFGFIKATIDFALNRDDLKDEVQKYIESIVKGGK